MTFLLRTNRNIVLDTAAVKSAVYAEKSAIRSNSTCFARTQGFFRS